MGAIAADQEGTLRPVGAADADAGAAQRRVRHARTCRGASAELFTALKLIGGAHLGVDRDPHRPSRAPGRIDSPDWQSGDAGRLPPCVSRGRAGRGFEPETGGVLPGIRSTVRGPGRSSVALDTGADVVVAFAAGGIRNDRPRRRSDTSEKSDKLIMRRTDRLRRYPNKRRSCHPGRLRRLMPVTGWRMS